MAVETHHIAIATEGDCQVVDLSAPIARALAQGGIQDGTVTLFVIGSTAGLTTTEFEPGLVNTDLRALFDRLISQNGRYAHEETWHDDNGHSHLRASLLGPSLTVPLVGGQLTLGTWQQVVLLDFDTRPRRRDVVVQVLGE